jgi:hypothetical protein
MKSFNLSFDGALLGRGFWIYVWEITSQEKGTYYYVGRTGDSSSPNAASPFKRISGHLDEANNAKGNSLYRGLRNNKIDPLECEYHFSALGPIFEEPEEKSMTVHIPLRDKMAAFEYSLFKAFHSKGYKVIGTHGSKHKVDQNEKVRYNKVIEWVNREFRLHLEGMT